MFLVLLFPCYGTGRGLITIYQRASFYKDPLQQALKAQALVMVIRDQGWKPQVGDSIRSLSLYPPKEVQSTRAQLDYDYYRAALSKSWIEDHVEKIKGYAGPFKLVTAIPPWLTMHYGLSNQHISVKRGYHISGACDLPEGYQLAYVPPNAQVEHIMPEIALRRILQSSYSLASGVISIVQIFSACSALYQSRGHQITAYGYAAFGFTVTPYLVMSFLNLLANCFNPSFPNLYLVHTEVMDEAISRGGHFTDIVGKLESEPLVAEDLTVFSASFKQRDDQLSCQIANQMFHHGSTEPILVSTTDDDSPEKDAKHSVSETTGSWASAAGPLKSTSFPDKEIAQKQAVAGEQDCRHEQPQYSR
ncbi:hypothetical protein Asppvi_008265 [Aspergillus pseudoviridinutans]|uniref:Uncharacterized protein n=1 Tax=Aspergillus pseudoviridinutans TaxID=1517512 RepID=A0A9P3BDD2_9EURO|nr:uncharacterized protein Asppvi_008265 [Aspergillus pseudoviridinutans]GIJ89327.1 hypothetical protein Asppvi_008265 [Aspergillus pseudoviridinutans]